MRKIKINTGKVYNNIQRFVVYGFPQYVLDLVAAFSEACSKDYTEYMDNSYKIPGLTLEGTKNALIVESKAGIKLPGKVSLFDSDEQSIQDMIEERTKEWATLTFDRDWLEMTCAEAVYTLYQNAYTGSTEDEYKWNKFIRMLSAVSDYAPDGLDSMLNDILRDTSSTVNISKFFEQFDTEALANLLIYSYELHGKSLIQIE